MAQNWEDYLLAGLTAVGGLAQVLDPKTPWFIVAVGAGLFVKALKDIRDSRQ